MTSITSYSSLQIDNELLYFFASLIFINLFALIENYSEYKKPNILIRILNLCYDFSNV